jgi:ParB/RepB/Spo0J family partition protein
LGYSADSWWGVVQSQFGPKAVEITGETAGVLRPRPQSQTDREGRLWQLRLHAMSRNDQAPIEVRPDEIGDRLLAVRLLPAVDQEMAGSLRRFGQLSPLVVFRDSDGVLEVIDGFRRRRAAVVHGFPAQLSVRALDVDEPRALAALLSLHRGGAGLCELEQAWIVRALVREHGLTQIEVAQLLRRHQSWISRRLLLVEALSPEVQADVRLGLVSATAAREVARLPRGIQQTVARIIARQGMSTRAATKLVAATEQLQAATAEEIERLCHSAQAAAPARPGLRSDAEQYTADLALLERVATRLFARLRDRPPARLAPPHAEEISGQLRAAVPVVRTLLDTMQRSLEGP